VCKSDNTYDVCSGINGLTEYLCNGSYPDWTSYDAGTTAYCTSGHLVNCSGTLNCNQNSSDACECSAPAACCNGTVRNYNCSAYCSGSSCGTCPNASYCSTEDCATKTSYDSDGGNYPYTGGYITDYVGCSGGSCTSNTYADTCYGTPANNLTEYYASGSSYSSQNYTGGTTRYCYNTTYDYFIDCTAPYKNCNQDPADVCEINTNTDNNNCGDCGVVCGSGTVCANGTCVSAITVSGNAYEDEGTTVWSGCGGTNNIALRVGGTTYYTSCPSGNSAFTFSNVAIPSAGTPMVIWFDGVSGNFGSNVNRYYGSGYVTGVIVRRNRVIVQHDDGGPVTNANMDTYDNGNDIDINYVVTTGALTVEAGSKLIINSDDTFTPGGTVTIDVDANGDLLVSTGATLNGTYDVTVNGGDVTGDGTINLTGGTFTLDGAGNFGGATNWTFNHLTFGNGSGVTTTTLTGANSITVSGNLTVAANQTLSGSKSFTVSGGGTTGDGTINLTGGTFLLDGAGNFGGATNWTFYDLTFGDGSGVTTTTLTGANSITVSNDMSVAANQTLSGSKSFTVNGGDVTGDGTITLTGGTFLLDGAGNFGGATAWTFSSLTIGGNANVETTTATGAGNITVSSVFTIGANQTLNAGSKTWILNGSGGTPFVKTGTLTPSTSTFRYDTGADTTITAATYYNLELIDPLKRETDAKQNAKQTQNSSPSVLEKIYQGLKENVLKFLEFVKENLRKIASFFKNLGIFLAKRILTMSNVDSLTPINKNNLKELEISQVNPTTYGFKSLEGDLIEIGTEKHSPSQPYLKLEKWEGEVSLKVDVPYGKESAGILNENKLTYSNHKYDVQFYPKEPEEIIEKDNLGNEYRFTINEQGGVEFDTILKEKPESNVFEFPIETKGLKFYYQPPLNQEKQEEGITCTETTCLDKEGKVVAFRPENVVGSYAVYHETQDKFFKTKEEADKYKTGKAFHIYRPKVFDANGNWVWAELYIDENLGILTVTVPQDFLNKAVYPVSIDPTFGYTTAGASTSNPVNDTMYGSVFTAPSDVLTATSLSFYVGVGTGFTAGIKGVLVLHSNLNIVTNGVGNAVSATGTGWQTSSFSSPPSLSPSTDYVLMLIPNFGILFYYDAGATNQGHYDTSNSYASPTNPTDATHNNNKYSIYCTYTSLTAPTVSTSAATNVTSSSATLNGNITATGGQNADLRGFEWGTTSGSYPNSWTEGTSGSYVYGVGAFSYNLTGLSSNTTYYFRAKAHNSAGWGYGSELSFTTGAPTYTLAAGSFVIQNNLLIGDGTDAVKVTADTNDPSLDVNGNFTIQANATFIASNISSFTVAGNWSNSGTFTHSNGTVTFDEASKTTTFSGSTTFYKLTCNTASKNLTFTAGTTQTIATGGTLTLNGQACGTMIVLRSSSTPTQWNINVVSGATASVNYVDVKDSNASGTAITANNSKNSGNNTNWTIDGGVCFMTVSGNAYEDETSTKLAACNGSTTMIALRVGGTTYGPVSCSASDGSFTISNVFKPSTGDPMILWIDGTTCSTSGNCASTVNRYAGSGNVTLMEVRKSRLMIMSDSGNVTNANLDTYDNGDDSDIIYTVTTNNLTLEDGYKLIVNAGDTYEPGGAVTTDPSSNASTTDGDILIESTAVMTVGTNAISCGGDWTNSGTFTKSSGQTTTFTATATGHSIAPGSSNFDSVTFNGTGGGWSFSAAVTIDGDLTMTAGTLSGTNNITVSGGDITGTNGSINLTGGTTTLSGTGNLGPTGTGTYTFYNLTLSGTTATTTLAGAITVSNDLSIGTDRTLALNSQNLTVQGGDILTTTTGSVTCSGCTAGTVTLSGTGTVGGGTGSITFYNFTLSGTTATTTLGTAITLLNDMTIGANRTLDVSVSNYGITVGGSWTNSGTFTRQAGTVTFNATTTGKTISDGGSPFYNITFNGTGGGWLYKDGSSTAPNQTTVQAGTPTYLNTKTGTVSVTGGTLNVDWYLGVHVVDAANTSTNIDTGDADITISENSATPQSTVWRHNGTDWGTAASSQTTGTDATGKNPQPNSAGAIRIREYSMTSSATCPGAGCTLYKYNLQIVWQGNYGEYDYYNDYGQNYLTSCWAGTTNACSDDTTDDDVIGVSWHRSTAGTMNTPYVAVNDPPTNGSWYIGMLKGLEVTITGTSIDFGSLDASNNFTATAGTQTQISVTTSATSGYIVTAWENQLMTCSDAGTCGSQTIQNFTYGTYADPQPWTILCKDNPNYCGFGFTSSDTLVEGSNRYNSGTEYTYFPTDSANPVRVADYSSQVYNNSYSITYRISVPLTQRPGPYQTTVVYVVTAQY
jgi:hypothetical protein